MEVRVKGTDELSNYIEKLSARTKELEGKHKVALDELFIEQFMIKYTDFKTLQCFAEYCENSLDSDFESIVSIDADKVKLNHLIKEKTSFENWDDMLNKASVEWMTRQLHLTLGV